MKQFSLFAGILFVFSLIFSSVSAQSVDIVVLLPDSSTSSVRWEVDDRRFFEEAFSEAGVSYRIVNAEANAETQMVQAEQAIGDGAKVLLMVNLDSASGAQIIELAHSQGLIVIDYDRMTIEGPGADYYVSFDNRAVGRLQGEGLVTAIKAAQAEGLVDDTPHIVALDGSPTDNNATDFRGGAFEIIQPYFDSGEWVLVDEEAIPNWDNEQGQLIFEAIQMNAEDIDGVLAANDGLAQAVINARTTLDLEFIPLTGQDATVGGLQNILAGRQSMTVYKAVRAEARAAAALAISLITNNYAAIEIMIGGRTIHNGTNDIPSILLVPTLVTAENIADTVIADGFRSWEDICVGDFAEFCPEER
jgi:D-xylose transport system substrate-binding protein